MYAIDADSLTKHYRVYSRPFDRLKEAITRKPCHDLVEALNNVSFQLPDGGTLGIIGENGAGKSTLLKILAGTTNPTGGRLTRQGRVAALLELGSGFHPDFSGRENIHLNAALLGLNEEEIKESEPAIIAFSELAEVIDRPVKTYSSGMYMRLAFSIATSVDPDILIIDEALSVGDQYFQQKCIDRMALFRDQGKTLLFCSHSMYLISELCEEAIWMENGRIRGRGVAADVLGEYLGHLEKKQAGSLREKPEDGPRVSGAPEVVVDEVFLTDRNGNRLERAEQFQPLVVNVRTRRTGGPFKGHVAVALMKPDEKLIFATMTKEAGLPPIEFVGEQSIRLVLPSLPLVSGAYKASAAVADPHGLSSIHDGRSNVFYIASERPELGLVWMENQWRIPGPGVRSEEMFERNR